MRWIGLVVPFVIVASADARQPPPCKPPKCQPPPPPVGRIIKLEVVPDGARITIAVGARHNVKKGMRGCVLEGQSTRCLEHGELQVAHVTPTMSVAFVALTPDEIRANPRVRIEP